MNNFVIFVKKNKIMNEIFKLAKLEAEWLRYYGHVDSRKEEKFEDINFYDRLISIGYCKKPTPLSQRCPMGYIDGLDENPNIIYGPRNHKKGVYTPLEYIIYNKIDGYKNLIKIIKE